MKKFIVICFLFIHIILPAAAERTYTADFLTFGTGARPLGMGNAFTAIADEASTTYYNPAGIAQLTHHEFNFMHATLVQTLQRMMSQVTFIHFPRRQLSVSVGSVLVWMIYRLQGFPLPVEPLVLTTVLMFLVPLAIQVMPFYSVERGISQLYREIFLSISGPVSS